MFTITELFEETEFLPLINFSLLSVFQLSDLLTLFYTELPEVSTAIGFDERMLLHSEVNNDFCNWS